MRCATRHGMEGSHARCGTKETLILIVIPAKRSSTADGPVKP
jgi:hypothetical protein